MLYQTCLCLLRHAEQGNSSNPFDQPAKFICTLTPDLYVEYFRDLSRLPVDDKGQLNPADIGRTMTKYATQVIQ